MNNKKNHNNGIARPCACCAILLALLALAGCTHLPLPLPAPPPPVQTQPPPAPAIIKADDGLPSLDVVIVAHHHQCETTAGKQGVDEKNQQMRDLMQWLKRNCSVADGTITSQLIALKKLHKRYSWPQSYDAWLDEWRRQLMRMQTLAQRAATAEAAQATMVKRLRLIERDLTTRP